jgi:hypothetical protein
MPYIGNPIYQSAFVVDQFSGNGSTTAFTMSVAPAGVTNVLVAVSGVLQDPSTYGVVGNTITFSAAPPSGTGNISCRYLGVPVTGVTTTAYRTVTEFTATAGQTTFTPPSYNVGFINVYLNGVLLGSADYTATNGTTVVLAIGASAGNLLTVESFQISSVANAIPNAAGSVSNSNLATASITSDKFASTTGSGAVVLATSPTLVTPALGTPSALILTNATSLPKTALPSGSVLQVVQSTQTTTTTYSVAQSWIDMSSFLSASITPISSSNKILIMLNLGKVHNINGVNIRLSRNSSALFYGASASLRPLTQTASVSGFNSDTNHSDGVFCSYLDSPATTSSTTYSFQAYSEGSGVTGFNRSIADVDNTQQYSSRAASSLILMEIAG